jgi:signal transduction histidine kinase
MIATTVFFKKNESISCDGYRLMKIIRVRIMPKSRQEENQSSALLDAIQGIRGPLAVISNATFLLEGRIVEGDDKAGKYLAMIRAEVERAGAMIHDIIDVDCLVTDVD